MQKFFPFSGKKSILTNDIEKVAQIGHLEQFFMIKVKQGARRLDQGLIISSNIVGQHCRPFSSGTYILKYKKHSKSTHIRKILNANDP